MTYKIIDGKNLYFVVLILLLSIVFAGTASAATLTVDDSGGADYIRIQDAINSAAEGDTILVYDGIYDESINVNKRLILTGVDSEWGKLVINGSKSLSTVILSANGITLEGFMITNGSTGINVISSNNFIKDNIVQNNIGVTGGNGYGIRLSSGSINNTFANNIIQNNKGGDNTARYSFAGSSYGIYLESGSRNNNFTGNIIRNNNGGVDTAYFSQGGSGFGIYLGSSSSNTFTNNTIENHKGGLGAYGNRGGSGYGVYLDSSNSNIFTNNTVQSNKGYSVYTMGGVGSTGVGIYMRFSSSNTFANNIVQSNNGGTGGSHGGGSGFGVFLDRSSNSNNFTNNAVQRNSGGHATYHAKAGSGYGVYLSSSSSNTFTNNTFQSSKGGSDYYAAGRGGDGYGIYLVNFTNSTFTSNTIRDNYGGGGTIGGIGVGIGLSSSSSGNIIYNNYFNNSNNFFISTSVSAWNISRTFRTNIIGAPNTGGNFWANPSGTGYSQTCIDVNGICNIPYTLDENNIDYLPLSMNFTLDAIPPTTTITLSGTLGNNSWYISDVQATLNATDNEGGSDVKITEYSFDGINWIQYNVPYSITNEGVTLMYYKSTDNAGNVESIINQTVNIDKTPPEITGTPTTSPNTNDWYNADVVVHFTASDTISGIDTVTPNTILSTEGINQSVIGIAVDIAGNSASTSVSGINIDKTLPIVTITTPANDGIYILNQSLIADWSATDVLSGLEGAAGTVSAGEAIDTSSVGVKTFSMTATDIADNSITDTVSYIITYDFLGILPSVKEDGSSVFISGSTIPVRFRIADVNGNYVSNAIANITYQFVTNEVLGTVIEPESTASATEGNTFRYDSTDNLYIFNLGTNGMEAGTYQLNINLDDGTVKTVQVSIK